MKTCQVGRMQGNGIVMRDELKQHARYKRKQILRISIVEARREHLLFASRSLRWSNHIRCRAILNGAIGRSCSTGRQNLT